MRNEPSVAIHLDEEKQNYQPGENLSGEYIFEGLSAEQIKAVEVSVLWYTEGKGDEDMAVHAFWRFDPENGDIIDPLRPARFETALPASPLSYEGQIVKVRWCVRVRAFLHRAREVFSQEEFRLGDVSPISAEADK
jgi:hypothetical protein